VCETYWYGTASLRLPLTTATIAAVIDLVLCFALIPRFDALGAAWANLGGQGSAAIMIIGMTRRVRHTVTLPWGRLLANALAMGVVGAAALWATQSFAGASGLALGILLGSAGALGFGRIVGFVGADDASWLSHTLPERLHVGMRWFGGRGSR
jgi:O-antigen/teichoic acid export membrane protein